MVTIITNRVGDIGIIFCVYLRFCLITDSFYLVLVDKSIVFIFIVFICFAGFTKRAQFPFRV